MHKRELPRDYINLGPTILESNEVHGYLREILDFDQRYDVDKRKVAKAIVEMLLRLTDTYSQLEADIGEELFEWVRNKWSTKNLEFLEDLCSILVAIENNKVSSYLNDKIQIESNINAKKIMRDYLDEY